MSLHELLVVASYTGPHLPVAKPQPRGTSLAKSIFSSHPLTANMRLLHVTKLERPLEISVCSFMGSDVPRYMILSHRWHEDEVLYADIIHPDPSVARGKLGYAKLEDSCIMALASGYEYVWIDTC